MAGGIGEPKAPRRMSDPSKALNVVPMQLVSSTCMERLYYQEEYFEVV